MSRSEPDTAPSDRPTAELDAIAARLADSIDRISASGETALVEAEIFQRLMTPLVKLYAAITEDAGRESPPTDQTVNATEAVILACALLRAQDLNPFDLAIWFSRYAPPPTPMARRVAGPRSPLDPKEGRNGDE